MNNPSIDRARLSLCMIARDSARTIEPCLTSIRPWVDEMVVVDTGSRDNTVELAERLGAKVFHFPWCDDFSAARNESLRRANGEWLLWMDSDDTIDPVNGLKLRALTNGSYAPDILGFVMQVHCPGPADKDQDLTIVDHVKVFRNRPDLRFDGRIHEQILPAIRAAGGQVVWSDCFVVHSGYDHSPEGQVRKRQRDFKLLHLELAERPHHPFTLFNLGMTYADVGEHQRAIEYLSQSLEHAEPTESHVRKAYALFVYCLRRMNRLDEAWQACRKGLGFYPQDAELLFRAGLLLHEMGRSDESLEAYQAAIDSQEGPHFSSIDPELRGIKARQNQAVVHATLGQFHRAELKWRQILAEAPGHRIAWRGLADALVRQQKYEALAQEADRLAGQEEMRTEALLLRADLYEAQQDWQSARMTLEQALELETSNLEPLRRLCRLLFEHGESAEAEAALELLAQRDPQDASALHNLANLHFQAGEIDQAIAGWQAAISVRPSYSEAFVNLGHALAARGQDAAAASAWESALAANPNCEPARAALNRIKRHIPELSGASR